MSSGNFGAMGQLGDTVMKPFLQDVIQFQPLLQTMQSQMMRVRGRGKGGRGGRGGKEAGRGRVRRGTRVLAVFTVSR